jgi:hypothetical protein
VEDSDLNELHTVHHISRLIKLPDENQKIDKVKANRAGHLPRGP